MDALKTKKAPRRRALAANSPEPTGPISSMAACGHSGCGTDCKVRYCGPTSHMRDHHILHAAKGVTHVWTAAIVTGFAIVLTGAVAFNAAQASSSARIAQSQADVKQGMAQELSLLNERVASMEDLLNRVETACAAGKTGGLAQ